MNQSDRIDQDADLRSSLAALGPDALRELQDVLTWPGPSRDALAQLRLIRALHDLTQR